MRPLTPTHWTKGHYALNLCRRAWQRTDELLAQRFPARSPTIPPASWVDELMAKRFGALIVCGRCRVKYVDGLRRWGYVRHPDMKTQGNACDFCKTVDPYPVPLWLKEEHQYPSASEHARQSAMARAPWPRSFRGDLLTRRKLSNVPG